MNVYEFFDALTPRVGSKIISAIMAMALTFGGFKGYEAVCALKARGENPSQGSVGEVQTGTAPSSGKNEGEKAEIRPADFVPLMRYAGISNKPISCTTSLGWFSKISSNTAGWGSSPAAIYSLYSFFLMNNGVIPTTLLSSVMRTTSRPGNKLYVETTFTVLPLSDTSIISHPVPMTIFLSANEISLYRPPLIPTALFCWSLKLENPLSTETSAGVLIVATFPGSDIWANNSLTFCMCIIINKYIWFGLLYSTNLFLAQDVFVNFFKKQKMLFSRPYLCYYIKSACFLKRWVLNVIADLVD